MKNYHVFDNSPLVETLVKIFIVIYFVMFSFPFNITGIAASEQNEPHSDQLELLANWMTGSFSSEEQAERDTAYHNVGLLMKGIWNEDEDGFWIYVVQALATNLESPYRQRIYQPVKKDDLTYESFVNPLPNANRFIAAWKIPEILNKLIADSLSMREGCSIILYKKEGAAFSRRSLRSCLCTSARSAPRNKAVL